ncbi:MAG: hypothetical protein PHE17_05055 [Thiothrix sp.]|uniref:hypothetical protein n=1 Tax=Thiothrix sp. TaxID=1032 RepID=UPI002624294A|nr:hypothetical protein [Thiothrix sp.]MDD5392369.1 hypothetical protein [Thiothrix sp.]
MDEDQFRAVYREINAKRCVFEKAINNRRCDCSRQERFLLATREGVGCRVETSLANCTAFLNTLREKSRFALHETFIDGPLPHNKELKVQAGGTLALQLHLFPALAGAKAVQDIYDLVNIGLSKYVNIADFPYGELVKGVVHYESRPKRGK